MENEKKPDHNKKSDNERKFSENASKNISGSGENKENEEIQKTDIVKNMINDTVKLKEHFFASTIEALKKIVFMERCRKQGFFIGCRHEFITPEGYLNLLEKVDKLLREWDKNLNFEFEISLAGYKEAKELFDEFPDIEKMQEFKKTAEENEDKLNIVKKILSDETDEDTEEEEYITEEEYAPEEYLTEKNKIQKNSDMNLDKTLYRKLLESLPVIRLTDATDTKINMEAGYAAAGIEDSINFILNTFKPNINLYIQGYRRMTGMDESDAETALELTLLCAILTFNPDKDRNFYEYAEDRLFATSEREKRMRGQLLKGIKMDDEDEIELYEDDDLLRTELENTEMLFECPEFGILKETFQYLTPEEQQYIKYIYSYDGSIAEFIFDENLTLEEAEAIRRSVYSNMIIILKQFMQQF